MDAIDLTKSDSDEEVRPVKRQRRSSPDDDVQVIEEPATRAPAAAGPEPTLGDEDLLITRATGPVWNEDLPHTRSQCGKHTFLTIASTRNREHCSKCFCYICDVEADKCKQWGSGSSSTDHCNAHGGRQFYTDMRTRTRAVGPAVATPAPNAALPSGWLAQLQRARNSGSTSAAGPSAPPTAERRQSSEPVGAVGPSAPNTQLRISSGASRAAFHSRTDCPEHPFQPSPSTANQRSCKMCVCFVCEDSVQLCKRWGTGEERVHHCNAHAGEQRYRQQREAFRHHPLLKSHPNPDEIPWPTAHTRPPPRNPFPGFDSSEEEHEEDYSDSEGFRELSAARIARTHGLSDGHASPGADRPPRPKQPMQPVERSSVLPNPALDNKLLEIGTIRLPIRAKAPYTVADLQQRLVPDGIGSRIHHDYSHPTLVTIHNVLYNEMLELLPLVQLEQGCEPTPMRVRRVTIVSHDGRAKPLTIGVTVHKEAKMAEMLAAVTQNHAASCNPEEEFVMAYCVGEKDPFTKAYLIRDMSTKAMEHHAKNGYVVFRVPRIKPAKVDTKGWKSPSRLVVYNKRPNTEPGGYPEWVDTAHTILLDLSGDLWKGGRDAEKQVAAMIASALAPYRNADTPALAPHEWFTLRRCTQSGYITHGSMRDFSQTVQRPSEYPASECISSGVMHLAAHWKPRGLDLHDITSWSQPHVHDTASAEIMAETERLIKEEEAAKKERKSREQRPKDLLSELSSACRTYLPDQIKLAKRSHQSLRPPIAACKLDILREEEAAEDCAILQVQVFVWKTHGAFNRDFFRSPVDWLPVDGKERRQHEPTHCLKEVMEYLLKDNSAAKAMREELKACAEKMRGSAPYSVTALMKWLQAEERPEAPQPPGLTVELRPYQRQSLRFMIDNEQGEGGHRRHFWVPYKTPSGFTFWWSPLFNRASREVAPCPWGGFLAEEMGCGKTVEILALILSNPAAPNVASGSVLPDGCIVSRATLVVCAVSLVGQWMEEAKSKLNGSLRMYQYHGQGRNKDPVTLATSYDLVVTTYQTLGSDWRMYNKKGSNTDGRFKPLGQIKWHRVVLDESHTVKAGGTQQTAACCALNADRRWCCSGTPISTEVSEFVGQFKFLGCQPFDNTNYFSCHIKPAWSAGGWQTTGGAVNLLYALGRTLIRHTQQQRLGGATVCKLPEKTEEAIAVEFSEAEQRLYLRVHKEAKAEFQKYANGGSMMVARNLLAIMSLLSPLRAICSGGLLRERDVRVPNKDQEEEVPNGVDPNLVAPLEECSICLNHDMERPCRTPCLHWFCRECITAELAVREKCPLCRTELQVAQLVEGVSAAREEDEEVVGAAGSSAGSQAVVSESKLRALLKQLADMRERDPTAKALIFTQFNSTLEWLMARLTEEGYSYRTISGSMPLKKRSQAIDAFQRDPPTTVFLLSMRSGAVGINLTAANHVFILEPAMNPALEDQAVGRAFRMGQTRPVTVKKLYIKGSVEERIMELVKDRREGRATGAAAAQAEYDEDTGRRVQKSKMRQQDVAGSIRMDRQDLRMAELQLLFQDPDFTRAAGVDQAAAYNAAPAAPACGGGA